MDSSTPNTDVALMIGMASHLIAKKKVDYEFLDTYTTGFDKFKDYLEGKEDGVKKIPNGQVKFAVSMKKLSKI